MQRLSCPSGIRDGRSSELLGRTSSLKKQLLGRTHGGMKSSVLIANRGEIAARMSERHGAIVDRSDFDLGLREACFSHEQHS
jgi:hypothetical protein